MFPNFSHVCSIDWCSPGLGAIVLLTNFPEIIGICLQLPCFVAKRTSKLPLRLCCIKWVFWEKAVWADASGCSCFAELDSLLENVIVRLALNPILFGQQQKDRSRHLLHVSCKVVDFLKFFYSYQLRMLVIWGQKNKSFWFDALISRWPSKTVRTLR